MEILRQLFKTVKRSNCCFAVYFLIHGDYRFCFASYNYYKALDFFLRLDFPNIILCRISVDELPDYAFSDAIHAPSNNFVKCGSRRISSISPDFRRVVECKNSNANTRKEKIKC